MEPITWWGGIGETFYGRLEYTPGASEGLFRLLGPCVAYEDQLPLAALGLSPWLSNSVDDRRFEMPFRGPPKTPTYRPLADFAENLLQAPPQKGDARLADLDFVINRLLEVAVGLHQSGWRVGFLTPRNIILGPGADGPSLHLPDLGFYSSSEDFEQPWLSPQHEFALLCAPDTPAVLHLPQGLLDTGPSADIRLMGRLLATVLLAGRVPSPQGRPGWPADPFAAKQGGPWTVLTEVPPLSRAPGLRADIWSVLDRAIRGEIDSMEELARQVKGHPPSQHFFAPSVRGASLTWVLGLTGAVASLLIAGGIGAWMMRGGPTKVNAPPTPVAIDPSKRLDPLPADAPPHLRAIEETVVQHLPSNQLTERIVAAETAEPPVDGEQQNLARQAIQRARWLLVEKVRAELHSKLDEAEENPQPALRPLLTRYFESLASQIRALQKFPADQKLTTEEDRCLEELGRLVRQLED